MNNNENKTQVTFWILNDDLRKFNGIAVEKRTSRAALLRECVLETIKKHKKVE